MDTKSLKKMAGEAAAEHVQSGMVVGLGHGSTAIWALRALAAKLRDGALAHVRGVACSHAVEAQAEQLDIPLVPLNAVEGVDLTIDGADEVDPALNLIKGGGGALVREKIVAQASGREIIVVDESKLSDALGTRFALPVEVLPFARRQIEDFVRSLGATVSTRRGTDGSDFTSDQGYPILDCDFGPIDDVAELCAQLDGRAGIIGHGLFLGLADEVIVGSPDGLRRLGPA
jgi:ribose 5-phosphate isomerase A